MSIEFAIQPVMHGSGYEVVRTADNAVLATVATAGEASQYINNLEQEIAYDALASGGAYIKPELLACVARYVQPIAPEPALLALSVGR